MNNITCCKVCGWGKSDTPKEEINNQIIKHNEYICKKCEEKLENIIGNEDKLKIKTVDGNFEAFITDDGVYYLNTYDGIVKNPKTPFLGFGGSTYLIISKKKCKPTDVFTKNNIIFTNNLWHAFFIPNSYRNKIKPNSKIIYIEPCLIKQLKEQLNKIKYWD